ncbi:TRAP transporter small permease [Jannaschia seohaensis]|uniref:TRAP transporter small permease protein n=1 Tax=Jannaschia seohaensis TaxID=475081 RepID=A0A2Y9ALK1_9RHOB|nr:TRAP transporter small permease [Jannaschia seohaensis]PWJ20208.1 TRAP-type C4-dicarboxylate transport system permease small subunit [Jannaschia seohaensis]SSA44198.1 TRAP-type C4-dicarboxylate transport system, small permease component [Jannaschia seohaensis]
MSDDATPSGPAPSGPIAHFRRVVDFVDGLSRWIIVLSMAGMALLVSAQVFMRYVMSSSIDAADELSRLFFVWSIFLAIPHGVRRGVHVGIDVFARMLHIRIQDALNRVSAIAGLVLMLAVFFTALGAAADKWGELMPTLSVTAALYYVPVCICAGHAALHLSLFAVGGPHVWGEDAWKEGRA